MRSHPSRLRTKISLAASFVITVALTVGVPSVAHADSINQLASWGYGLAGELGNGATTNSSVPLNVTTSGVLDGKSIAQLSAGRDMTCVLDTAGLAYCWGVNSRGQLGNSSTTSSSVPVAVSMPTGVTFASISAGASQVCAVSTSGAGYCWGYGYSGQLGGGYYPPDPYYMTAPQPVSMPSGETFRSISAGNQHTCAVTVDNLGYCWGNNGNGQLGAAAPASSNEPIAVTGGLLFSSIEAGKATTCGITTTNTAYCWGFGGGGELGDNSTTLVQSSPVAVSTTGTLPDTYSQFSSGSQSESFCGVTASGEAWCWGSNSSGQLGNGSVTDARSPVQVTPVTARTFSTVATGANYACALTNVGEVYCWGGNNQGQLGDNSLTNRSTPTPVVASGVLQNSQMTMLSAGEVSTFVIATTVPGPPTSVGATAGTESATVSWAAPVRTGGTAITEYTVTSTPGSRTCTTAGTSCTVSGLTAGTSYTFTVVATNARGTSLASSATTAVTPTANSGGGGGGGGGETPATNSDTPVAAETNTTNTVPAQTTQSPMSPADKLASGDINELSPTEIRSLPASAFSTVSRATMSLFTQEQVSVLTKSQLRAITPFALKGLTPAAVKGLTAKQLAELTAKQKAAFTKEQRAAMTDKQRKALQPKKRRT